MKRDFLKKEKNNRSAPINGSRAAFDKGSGIGFLVKGSPRIFVKRGLHGRKACAFKYQAPSRTAAWSAKQIDPAANKSLSAWIISS